MSKDKRLIQLIVAEIHKGASVSLVATKYKIPLRTAYYWRAKYETVRSKRNLITMREVKDLERRYNELKQILDTVVSSPFIQDVLLQDREAYMVKLEDTIIDNILDGFPELKKHAEKY